MTDTIDNERIAALTAEVDTLARALIAAMNWHLSADKALSKSGRTDTDYHWRRGEHAEQIGALQANISPYEARIIAVEKRIEREAAIAELEEELARLKSEAEND
jgi:hypothetical protein